jgi:tetratricopeptide (TPR) repeat protein/SAM-dependent methyltransferase
VADEAEIMDGADAAIEHEFAAALRCHRAGQLSQADELYRRVLSAEPDHVECLHHLGVIALQTGRHEDARDPIARNDRVPECHYHIGLAFALLGDMDAAAVHNRRAIELAPDYADAHLNLGNVLKAQGKPDESAACYERVLALRPQSAEARYNLANVLGDQGRLDAAIAQYREALVLRQDYADAHNNLGTALAAKGELSEAVAHYQRALMLAPGLLDGYANLASALLANGDAPAALGVVARSLAMRETQAAKTLFVACTRALQSFPPAPEFRELVIRALAEAWGRPGELAPCATVLIKQSTILRAWIERTAAAWPKHLPMQDLLAGPDFAAIADDRLLQCLMESTPLLDLALERFLTCTRSAVLELAGKAGAADQAAPGLLDFGCALARQCFINEYVYDAPEREWEAARRLHDALAAALLSAAPIPVLWPVAVAGYFPLHSLPGAQALLDRDWPAAVAALLVQQVREPAEEAQIRASLRTLTAIDDDVSLMVRRQYEENPYPRWMRAPASMPATFDQHMRRQFPLAPFRAFGKPDLDVLIAGCGTGRHSIAIAQMLAGARVLAIDLSASSLCYAMRKSRECGLRNIEYMQADILRLGAIGRTFDLIDSTGVLHHLADPWAGWRVLVSLLRPGGCMRIGLYSASARRDVTGTMAFIAERGYGRSAGDIRRCRQEIMDFPSDTPQGRITTSWDFFSTSDCRDLLFHVQQHGTTIPAIKEFLQANGLELLGFELDARVLRTYSLRFPEDPARTNLDLWDVFESENPYIFTDMYVFVVQKQR